MKIVDEISMYPLRSDYIPPIDDFLAQLNAESSVEVKTNRMSTQLYGDHDTVMDLLERTTRESRERFGGVAFAFQATNASGRRPGSVHVRGAVRGLRGHRRIRLPQLAAQPCRAGGRVNARLNPEAAGNVHRPTAQR